MLRSPSSENSDCIPFQVYYYTYYGKFEYNDGAIIPLILRFLIGRHTIGIVHKNTESSAK